MTLPARPPAPADSPVGRWDARWKLLAVAAAIVAAAVVRSPVVAAALLFLALLLAAVGRVPATVVAGRLGLVLLAVAPVLVVVPVRLFPEAGVWFRLDPDGLSAAAGVAARALAVAGFAVVLVRTGPFARTLAAAHAIGVPGKLVLVAQLADRFATVLTSEVRRTRIAARTRGFRPTTSVHTYRTFGGAVGALLVRTGDRAERVADAMACRGFDGTARPAVPFRTTAADVAAFAAIALAAGGAVLADRYL